MWAAALATLATAMLLASALTGPLEVLAAMTLEHRAKQRLERRPPPEPGSQADPRDALA